MAERKQTSPEVLRERSPAPRAFPRYWTTAILPPLVASPPLTGEIRFQRASRYHFPQGLSDARADFIDYRTRYPSSLTSARDRSEHTGRRVARTRIPPTSHQSSGGAKEIALSFPTALEGLSPSALQHRPLSAISRSLWLHAVFRSGDYLQRLFGRGTPAKAPLPEAAPPVSESPRDSFSARPPPLTLRLSRPGQNGPSTTPPRTAILAYSETPSIPHTAGPPS